MDCYICGTGSKICAKCQSYHLGAKTTTPELIPVIDPTLENDILTPEFVLANDIEGYDIKKEKAKIKEVETQGFKVFRSLPNTLLLDLDSDDAIDRFKKHDWHGRYTLWSRSKEWLE